MPTFVYKAKKKSAETVLGQIFAENKEEAIEKINHLELVPIKIEERGVVTTKTGHARPQRVKHKLIYMFSRQLVNLLKAGISILRALDIISNQVRNEYFKNVIDNIHAGIKEGKTFSDCLAEYPRIFSALYVTMVRAGEESGNLKETISDITEYLKTQGEITAKVKTAMAYPMLMATFGIGTVVFILTYVMPQITGLFVSIDQQLPLPTVIVMKISHILVKWWMWILLAVLTLILIVKTWLKTRGGRLAVSQLKLTLPYLSGFWLKVELARFCRTLQLLIKSGVSIVKALKLSTPVIENEILQKQLSKCHDDLVAGKTFSDSLQRTTIIPEMVGQLIAVGEESGSLSSTLSDVAESYELETSEAIKVMTTLVEPLLILLVGSVVGFLIIAMLLPIFQMDIFAR